MFQVDEADYASIVSQVKNAEFDREITRRLHEIDERIAFNSVFGYNIIVKRKGK